MLTIISFVAICSGTRYLLIKTVKACHWTCVSSKHAACSTWAASWSSHKTRKLKNKARLNSYNTFRKINTALEVGPDRNTFCGNCDAQNLPPLLGCFALPDVVIPPFGHYVTSSLQSSSTLPGNTGECIYNPLTIVWWTNKGLFSPTWLTLSFSLVTQASCYTHNTTRERVQCLQLYIAEYTVWVVFGLLSVLEALAALPCTLP